MNKRKCKFFSFLHQQLNMADFLHHQKMQSLLESGEFSDVTLVVGQPEQNKKELKVHRFLLSAFSPVFAAMFSHTETKEALEKRVVIEDLSTEAMERLLRYIYIGKLELPSLLPWAAGESSCCGRAVHSPERRGLTWLGRCQRPTTRVSQAQRARPEKEGVDNDQFTSGWAAAKYLDDVSGAQIKTARSGATWFTKNAHRQINKYTFLVQFYTSAHSLSKMNSQKNACCTEFLFSFF